MPVDNVQEQLQQVGQDDHGDHTMDTVVIAKAPSDDNEDDDDPEVTVAKVAI